MNLRRRQLLCVRASGCGPLIGWVRNITPESTRWLVEKRANMSIGLVGGCVEAWKRMATALQDVEAHA